MINVPQRVEYLRTSPQRRMLQVTTKCDERRNYWSTLHEISDANGTSPAGGFYQLFSVQGYKCLQRNSARQCMTEGQLPGHPVVHLEDQDLADSRDIASSGATYVSIPVIGQIRAGDLNVAEQVLDGTFLLPKQIVGDGPLFMLKVVGDSMINAAITDGNWVVVRQQPEAENGEIVAVMIDGQATVKTLQWADGHVWLVPQNPDYTRILGDEATILGKVVAVVRQV
jgi:repressor LexA